MGVMEMKRATLALSCLLMGCATVRPILRDSELVVYPHFAPHSQSVIQPLSISSIATLDIVPYVEDTPGVFKSISATNGNATVPEDPNLLKLTQASPSIDSNRPFVIRQLKPNKTYRVYGKAYSMGNALISQDAVSYVQVSVGSNDAPAVATLPVQLIDTPFGATTSVIVNTDGRFDYLKTTLYLVSNNSQVALSQTTQNNPNIDFANLQGNTTYKLVAEAYKLGGLVASNSLNILLTNDNAPSTSTLSLTIPYYISTVAGNGTGGYAGDGGPATSARIWAPNGVTTDPAGNLYIADHDNHRVRKVSSDGTILTVAGNGVNAYSGDGGQATNASLYFPYGVSLDIPGNLYIADFYNHCIRKVSTSGVITTVAGNGTAGFSGDGGQATAATLKYPFATAVDAAGSLFIADNYNHRIRKVSTGGVITTVAGNGVNSFSGDGGQATSASLNKPSGIAVDAAGNLYIADNYNNRIRKVSTSGVITTVAGNGATGFSGDGGPATSACLKSPYGIAVDAVGNLYVSDNNNNRIRKVSTSGVISTIGGNGTAGSSGDGGAATNASLNAPQGIAVDALGNLYVGDSSNSRVRKMQ